MKTTEVLVLLETQDQNEALSTITTILADDEDYRDWLREVLIQTHSYVMNMARFYKYLADDGKKVTLNFTVSSLDNIELWSFTSELSSLIYTSTNDSLVNFYSRDSTFENVICHVDPDIGTSFPKSLL